MCILMSSEENVNVPTKFYRDNKVAYSDTITSDKLYEDKKNPIVFRKIKENEADSIICPYFVTLEEINSNFLAKAAC